MFLIKSLSKWLNHRDRKQPCTTIVLHATAGGTFSGALEALKNRGLSYHFIIEKDGTIEKLVPYNKVAYHAGVSHGPTGDSVNNYSIGICFVNRNNGTDAYTKEQVQACNQLIADILKATKDQDIFPIKWLTSHRLITLNVKTGTSRKTDPKGFDLYEVSNSNNLKVWSPLQ